MERLITPTPQTKLAATNLGPKLTKALLMQVFVPSIALASLAASGPGAASGSKPLPAWSGRSTAGPPLTRTAMTQAVKTQQLPLPMPMPMPTAVARRTRRTAPAIRALSTATMEAATMRPRALLASTLPRRHPWQSPSPPHNARFLIYVTFMVNSMGMTTPQRYFVPRG